METVYKEIRKNNLDTTKLKVLSVGAGTRDNKWYNIVTVAEEESDPFGIKLYIPMYEEDTESA